MTKKVLLFTLAIGLAFGAIAQDREKIEQDGVKKRYTEFFNDINNAFAKHDKYSGPNWYDVGNNGKQFIVDELAKFGIKASGIQKQFDALENDKKISVQLTHADLGIKQAQAGKKDMNCYTSTHEVKAIATKNNVKSIVRNRVTIKWIVDWNKYDPKNNEWKKGSFGEKGKAINIVSVSTQEIDLISSERATIASNINAAIREWYGNINNNFQHSKAGLNRGECNPIVIKEDLSQKTFVTAGEVSSKQPITVKSVPAFNVYSNNPMSYIKPGEELNYTNPEAYWKVQPTFNVTVDMETFQVTNIEPSYKNTFKAPESDQQKMAKLRAAASVASNYADKVNQYAQASKGKEKTQLKNEILEMFAGNPKKDKTIQFSLIKKNGEEMQKYIDKPTTPKSYIEHLPACEFSMNNGYAHFGENTDEVIVDYIQTYKQIYPENYKGTKYADKTHKAIYFIYDAEKDTWLINKITAEKGSTVLIENE
jgi:hypothetical protein